MLEKNHVEEFYLILVLLLSHIIFLLRGSLAYKYFLHTPTYTKQFHLPLKMCDQDQQHLTIFSTTIKTSNSFPSPVLCDSPQVQVPKGTLGHDHYHQRQEEPADLLLMSGSSTSSKSDHTVVRRMMASDRTVESKPGRVSQAPHHEQLYSQVSSGNNSPGGVIRVCSACSTTKTPLWRSGPLGPKSLCNACGIRRRKARRADAAAAAAASDGNRILPYKKRCKILGGGTAHQKLHFDDIGLSLGNSSALHQVFPEDEKDAAILLMALSSGLIHG